MTMPEFQSFTAEREWTIEGIPVLTASISVPEPVPASDKISRRIRRYYQLQCRSYLRYCEKWLLPQANAEYHTALASSTPLPCFRAELGYHITYQEQGLFSLYTQSREVTLPGQTLLTRRGDTWDLSSGYPIPLTDFFPFRSAWRHQLLAFAAEEIQRQENDGISRYHKNWPRDIRRHFNSQNYYLSSDGLTFFFPMYSIAPSAEGIPTFTIPYGENGPFFTPQTHTADQPPKS